MMVVYLVETRVVLTVLMMVAMMVAKKVVR
jgi:hypothetical protein